MAKTLRKPKTPSTTLASVEKLFGPVLPGEDEPAKTISVFQELASRNKYKLFGHPGILTNALWHLHTPLDIDLAKVKGPITGIMEEGQQHDPNRREVAAQWLNAHNALQEETRRKAQEKLATQQAAAKAAEARREKTDRKNEGKRLAAETKKAADAGARRKKEEAATLERERKVEFARKAADRAGEYDAQLFIGSVFNVTLPVRVKIDAKGKVTLIGANKIEI